MPEFIGVLVNAEPSRWAEAPDNLTFGALLGALDSFFSVLSSAWPLNRLCVVGFSNSRSDVLLSCEAGHYSGGALLDRFSDLVQSDLPLAKEPLVSVALGQALCIAAKEATRLPGVRLSARLLVVDLERRSGYAAQHPALTNVAFACSEKGIPIDLLHLPETEPPCALQQLCDVTQGVGLCYRKMAATLVQQADQATALQGILLFHFLPNSDSRKSLSWARSAQVNYAVTCCCHGEEVKIAEVCSSCLRVYCVRKTGDCAFCVRTTA